ncbi:MAG: HAMP domain-containing histidine kinase [Nevskia sp.]|nr:HAMP domain-containing histidine kinase [Nevskia sp.]
MAGLVALACVLAASPLLVGLALAVSELQQLTRHSELLVQEGLAVVRLGSQLRGNVEDLDRSARQYIALRDPALLDVVDRRFLATARTLQLLQELGLAPLAQPLQHARTGLGAAASDWSAGLQRNRSLAAAAARVHDLAADADSILASGRSAIDQQIVALRLAGAAARRVILVSAIALLPLTALLAVLSSIAVMRPLRKLSLAIAELGHGRRGGAVAIGFPSEMRRLGKRLDWLRRRLETLEADRDRFLRNVLHELKTPLSSLLTGSALLQEADAAGDHARRRELAAIVAESGAELGGQIDRLLNYAQWRREQRAAVMDWFEVRPLIADVLARQKPLMDLRRLQPELVIDGERLFGHRTQLRVALANLIANAIKHAPPGSLIEIEATLRGGRCELRVRDYGCGVPAFDRSRIFQPFVRGAGDRQSGLNGNGVGLSIVQETVLTHSGIVEVEDAQPGARFKLAWPYHGQRRAA